MVRKQTKLGGIPLMVVLPLSLAQAGILHWTMIFMLLIPFNLRNLMQLAIL
jgi:hypothetical protein